ncbi:MAG: exopolysaccharide Pel transporter PelG [Lachnospiraceae bacterium]|nr:exopolysaccharide Pel transporter PelG [Lachnospiraceae bacterium]
MAGIGFELKKMFSKRGLLANVKAYGYAGIVCVGPMLLGVILLIGIRLIAVWGGAAEHTAELLNSMITYTLLFSMILTNMTSLVSTRFIADQLYMEKKRRILPSFWGCITLMMIPGALIYGVFLHFAGIPAGYQLLCFILFGELVIVWTEINYLTAIKDYSGIIITFAVSLFAAWGIGAGLIWLGMEVIYAMLLSISVCYGIMLLWYYKLMAAYFPKGKGSSFYFLEWFDRNPQLSVLGTCLAFGLFGHLIIMWSSPVGKQIQGLFYGAPVYDVSALLAFLSILITTINFVTSVEVNFYPKYRNYFSLFNDGGSLMDLEQAEREMTSTLKQEMSYTYTKQFFATIVFLILGTYFLPDLPLGITDDMLGIYRVLCVAYAFYAIGNCNMLLQLYFADNNGALLGAALFCIISCAGTWVLRTGNIIYYGIGFLAGSVVFAIVSLLLLYLYVRKVMYHVLCNQPIVERKYHGRFSRLSKWFEMQYRKK